MSNNTTSCTPDNGTCEIDLSPLSVPELDSLLGITAVVACFLGVLGNILTIRYFAKDRRNISNLVYLWMITVDIITCTSAFHFGIGRLFPVMATPFFLRYPGFCNVFGFLYNISSRLSVFLVALQSILRSLSLVYPFRVPRKRIIVKIIVLMGIVNMVQATIPYWRSKTYHYDRFYTLCLWILEDIVDPKANYELFNFLYIVTMVMPILLPAVPVLISCAVSVRYVWRRNGDLCEAAARLSDITGMVNSRLKHRATVTILIVTVVYMVLNIPYWIYLIFRLIFRNAPITKFHIYFLFFLNPVSIILNGFINPIVYYLRIAGMKKQVNGGFRNIQFPKSPAISRRKLTPKTSATPVNVRNVITLNNLRTPICSPGDDHSRRAIVQESF